MGNVGQKLQLAFWKTEAFKAAELLRGGFCAATRYTGASSLQPKGNIHVLLIFKNRSPLPQPEIPQDLLFVV